MAAGNRVDKLTF